MRERVFDAQSVRPERCKLIQTSIFGANLAMLRMGFAALGFALVYRYVVWGSEALDHTLSFLSWDWARFGCHSMH